MRYAIVVAVAAGLAWGHEASGAITRCERVTDLPRVVDGAFRPQSRDVAIVRYDRKQFNRAGDSFGFDVVVDLLSDGQRRELLRVPPYIRHKAHTLDLMVRWLPGGRYLYAQPAPFYFVRGGWLMRWDGKLRTRAGQSGEWFVTNCEVALTDHEARALNSMVHEGACHVECQPRWLWDGLSPDTDLPIWHGIGYEVPRRATTGVQFADLRSARRPASGETVGDGVVALDSPLVAPRLWFTCGDPANPSPSPGGGRVLYRGTAQGTEESELRRDNYLWVRRADGAGRRQLTWCPIEWFAFLDREWAVYAASEDRETRQLAVVNVGTSRGQWLTKGHFRHYVRDYRDGAFLISETVDRRWTVGYTAASALYVLEPLRVEL